MEPKDLILIGQITGPQGLHGEVKIYSYAQEPERFSLLKDLYVANKAAASLGTGKGGARQLSEREESPLPEDVTAHAVKSARIKGAMPIVQLADVTDRTAAEALRLRYVYMDAAELPPLPEGEYYVRDLLGADVVTEEGEWIGTLADIRTDTPQRLYEVKREDGRLCLIPGVDDFIRSRSVDPKKIVVRIPEGLLEL